MLNLIGVIVAFVVIIYLIRKKFNFGLSLIIGSIIVAIFSLIEKNFINIFKAYLNAIIYDYDKSVFNFETIELALLLTFIFILAQAMQETGAIKKAIKSLETIFYKGGTLGIIPAVYGLMPVPGGALFSAPLINKEGDKFKLSKDRKNFLNVWFRHIWFPIFPVSSAMMLIISSDFANIDIYELIIANIPAFIAFIVIGLIFLKIYIKKIPKPKKTPQKVYSGLIYLLPPVIPIFIYIIFFIIFWFFNLGDIKIFQRSIFIGGVILSIFCLYYLIDINWKKYYMILKNSLSLKFALIIVGIMVFREIIEVSESNDIIAELIGGLPIHPVIIIILVPLIMGLITGYNLGAIALSYFLVTPFFEISNLNIIGFASLVFISSLIGYLISPIHLCNIVSSEHLKTDTTRMYKMYIPACLALLILHTTFIILFYR
jgi:integral membrane protein (TIGR00529 family)